MLDQAWMESVIQTPLPGDQPCGEDARFDPRYEAIKEEIGKLEALAGEEVNWAEVRRQGCDLLATASKDLTLAVYISVASLHLGGILGLRDGLRLVDGLCRQWWEPVYPTRQRGRRSALAWLSERSEAVVAGLQLGSADEVAALDECFSLLGGLWEYVQPLLEEDPGLGGLSRALREKRQAQAAATAEAPAAEAASTPASTAAPTSASPVSGVTVMVEKKLETRADAYAKLREVADFLARIEPHSPVPLLLRRAMTWGEMGFEQVIMELINKDKEATRRVKEILGLGED